MFQKKPIEPSEILVGEDGTIRDQPAPPNPWLRFLARMFDYSLWFIALWAIALSRRFGGKLEPMLVPFEYFLWIPVEALLLRWLGTTPGKWLMGIQLHQSRWGKFDFLTALRRSFNVWFRGFGMGIPFINILCMLVAFQRLKTFRITTWDRDDHIQVTYRRIGQWRIIIAIAISVFAYGYYFSHTRF